MRQKDINKDKLLTYISNPENDFPSRGEMSVVVLGYSDHATLYRHFTPSELDEIEVEAFENRKKRSSKQQSQVYKTLHAQALSGDVAASKEWLNRVAGKVIDKVESTQQVDITGFDIKLIQPPNKK